MSTLWTVSILWPSTLDHWVNHIKCQHISQVNVNILITVYVTVKVGVLLSSGNNSVILLKAIELSTCHTYKPMMEEELWTQEDCCLGRKRSPAPTMSVTRYCRTRSVTTWPSARRGLLRKILLVRSKLPVPTTPVQLWLPKQSSSFIWSIIASMEDKWDLHERKL